MKFLFFTETITNQIIEKIQEISDSLWKDRSEATKYKRVQLATRALAFITENIDKAETVDQKTELLNLIYQIYDRLRSSQEITNLYNKRINLEILPEIPINYHEYFYAGCALHNLGRHTEADYLLNQLGDVKKPSYINRIYQIRHQIKFNHTIIHGQKLSQQINTLISNNSLFDLTQKLSEFYKTTLDIDIPKETITPIISYLIKVKDKLSEKNTKLPLGSIKLTRENTIGKDLIFVCGFGWSGSGAVSDYLSDLDLFGKKIGFTGESVWLQGRRKIIGLKNCIDTPEAIKNLYSFVLNTCLGIFNTDNEEDSRYLMTHSIIYENKENANLLFSAIESFLRNILILTEYSEHIKNISLFATQVFRINSDHEKPILLNNSIMAPNITLAQLFPMAQFVIVQRNPLDIYCARVREFEKEKNLQPEDYYKNIYTRAIQQYQNGRSNLKRRSITPKIIEIKFEEFVLDEFIRFNLLLELGIKPTNNLLMNKKFDPSTSKNNVGIHREFEDQQKIEKLSQLLKEKINAS
jgi:hypothetical protein